MRLLFICQGNTCRSPIAEGLTRRYGAGLVEADSAGLLPGRRVSAQASAVMAEIGIDLERHHPRSLEKISGKIDCVISLCEVIAPGQDLFPNARRLRWRIPDPAGGSTESYRATRDRIWDYLRPLLERLTERDDLPEHLTEREGLPENLAGSGKPRNEPPAVEAVDPVGSVETGAGMEPQQASGQKQQPDQEADTSTIEKAAETDKEDTDPCGEETRSSE